MSLALFGGALGGLGLFLLGMRLMTEGLKVAVGGSLRGVLTRSTGTHLRGLLSGALITGLVQASGAVVVASIGFVNAGIMNLGQAMWVIFGSNIGTTATGWIVAVVGFDIKIEAFALPLLGAGMFLSLSGTSTRRGAFGEAIAGFGVFFLGLATLKATFAGFGSAIDLASFAGSGILDEVVFVVVGFMLTTLVQSSSAVIAIALTAATSGILTIQSGAAMVIGANVGTTSTALFAVIGATSNARRVAVSHVVFNVLTGLVALLLLPVLLLIVDAAGHRLTGAGGPALTLALFHTVFNVLGVLLMWPLAGHLQRWLATRFVTAEEDESRPRFLDGNILEVPSLAVNSVLLELARVADIALAMARAAMTDSHVSAERLWRRRNVIERLNTAIIDYIQRLNATKQSAPVAEALAHPIRALWHFSEIADLGLAMAERRYQINELPESFRGQLDNYATVIAGQLDEARRMFEEPTRAPPAEETTKEIYQRAKANALAAASGGVMSAAQTEIALETLNDMKELVRHLNRVGIRVAAIALFVHPAEEKEEPTGQAEEEDPPEGTEA